MRRWTVRNAALLGGGLAALLATGCSQLPPGVDGDLVNGWAKPPAATAFVPAAGVCHAEPRDVSLQRTYEPISCALPHRVETFYLGRYTGAAATASEAPDYGSKPQQAAYQDCARRVSTFVGGPWRTGAIDVYAVPPGQAGWTGGARWYRCDVSQVDVNTGLPVKRAKTMARALSGPAPLKLRCFNPVLSGNNVTRMTPTSCTKKHRAEFAGLWIAPNIGYSQLKGDQRTDKGCRAAIAKFAKVPNDNNLQYRTGWISTNPTQAQWAHGERAVQCFVWLNGRNLTRSLRGVGTSGMPINYA